MLTMKPIGSAEAFSSKPRSGVSQAMEPGPAFENMGSTAPVGTAYLHLSSAGVQPPRSFPTKFPAYLKEHCGCTESSFPFLAANPKAIFISFLSLCWHYKTVLYSYSLHFRRTCVQRAVTINASFPVLLWMESH